MLVAVTLLSVCVAATSCSPKEKKYDVSVKVVRREVSKQGHFVGPVLEEWIFTPDISELTIVMENDGKKYDFYVDAFTLIDHPRWNEVWLTPNGYHIYGYSAGAYKFDEELTKMPDNKKVSIVDGRRKYTLEIDADSFGTVWNVRNIKMVVYVLEAEGENAND